MKKILVLGLGFRTGLAAGNFLARRGLSVTVSDTKSEQELADVMAQLDPAVKVIAGRQDPSILDGGFDTIVLSPGVPQRIPIVSEARKRNIPVISEIELAWPFLKGIIVAITGTDGKSTTTALTTHVLSKMGMDARMGGNIGIPLISIAEETSDDSVTVIELSSFQLETIASFRPHVAAILNVTPDHLDRYPGMNEYTDAKFRITMNQLGSDIFIYNLDDSIIVSRIGAVKSQCRSFSLHNKEAHARYADGMIYIKDDESRRPLLETDKLSIIGLHNVQNAMASALMVEAVLKHAGMAPDYDRIASALCSFTGLAHRMEILGSCEGRLIINDSKATTVGALEMAVKSIKGHGVFIIGGRTKGDDYSRMRTFMDGRVRGIVLVGESAEEFAEIFRGLNTVKARDLDDALGSAMAMSGPGDSIVLSPACASFDMFKNYEQRGDIFRESYNKLCRGIISWT